VIEGSRGSSHVTERKNEAFIHGYKKKEFSEILLTKFKLIFGETRLF
jgi:hypothetical protein